MRSRLLFSPRKVLCIGRVKDLIGKDMFGVGSSCLVSCKTLGD